ncbi:mechanosensitive ion channel family protein [Gaetbulibacter aestuarii]|uniref:Mechanosensitive ion channel domain-containing protein n=1 Tax=Gaetbulibacter aestuarii TaxID=1502358 RepID=A0ABW7MWY4_9FLAO
MEHIKQWVADNPTLASVVKFALLVVFVLSIIQLLRRFLRKQVTDTTARYKSQKGIEVVGYIILILLSFSYFTGTIKDLTLVLGLFTAGVAFTLQELILSVAGSLYIFTVKVYTPGDRIEINNIKGDVIDVDTIYTTMMEIGQWVSSDNYTGRIVKLSNAFVFKGPVYNYSKDFPFIWDEFNLPIKYGSDIALTEAILTKISSQTLSQFTTNSKKQWRDVVNKYYIEDAMLDPTIAVTLTDNWIQFNLRYIVDYKKRRSTKNALQSEIYNEILKTKGKVKLASATLELMRLPEIEVKVTS